MRILVLEFSSEKGRSGSPNYIAREILDGKTEHSYDVDTWSLGVMKISTYSLWGAVSVAGTVIFSAAEYTAAEYSSR